MQRPGEVGGFLGEMVVPDCTELHTTDLAWNEAWPSRGGGAPGRTRTADAGLRTASLCPLSYGGARRNGSAAPAGNRGGT